MHSSTWKRFEGRVAKVFGGRRRGAHTGRGTRGTGLSDVEDAPGWAIECGLFSRPSFEQIRDKARQAEAAAGHAEIPIAVIGKKGQNTDDALVVMRLAVFREWFVWEKDDAFPVAGPSGEPPRP